MKKSRSLPRPLRLLNPWWFVLLTVVCGALAVYALRANNLHMEQLRSAVYAADKDNGDVKTALQNLQAYVTTHMNTELASGPNAVHPPIQLQYTYERQQQAAFKGLSHSDFYTKIQQDCQREFPTDYFSYVACNEQRLKSSNLNINVGDITPPVELYKFDFTSPIWSPDLAGWSIVATILLAVTTLCLFVARVVWRSRKA